MLFYAVLYRKMLDHIHDLIGAEVRDHKRLIGLKQIVYLCIEICLSQHFFPAYSVYSRILPRCKDLRILRFTRMAMDLT